ncbi:MAG: NUDIX domain-containing protein [Candidatus Jorgensenbacteria bacterium]
MPKISAGLLMYRIREGKPEFFLVHPGGPFWKNKDEGAWSIPKGGIEKDEGGLTAAKREFEEETGFKPTPKGPLRGEEFKPLTPVRQRSGKIIHAWAFVGDCNPATLKSITSKIKVPWAREELEIPEVDKAGFFRLEEAVKKINPAQAAFLKEALDAIQNKR